MQGYTQIRTTKSKSIDFADLSLSPKPNSNPNPNPVISQITNTHNKIQGVFSEQQEENGDDGERFGVVLSRSCSVSSSANKVRAESPSLMNSAVMRAFSMRKSSSVSEGYCRIHDQFDHLSPIADVITTHQPKKQKKKKKKKKNGFLKACMRLFGFNSK